MRPNIRLPLYDIHPVSIKLINKGHPWILKDKFTEKFNPQDRFIIAKDRKKSLALLLHDPLHKNIKARVWATQGNFQALIQNFRKDLQTRIRVAAQKRIQMGINQKRENFYLVFGEADLLPGLFVQMLGQKVLIQFYTQFWKNYQDNIVKEIVCFCQERLELDTTQADIWIQLRADGDSEQKEAICLNPNTATQSFHIQEYGVKYLIKLGEKYDCGIYTDMAAVRDKTRSYFENSKSVLNLFSYTGAFSLFALQTGAEKVTSVDLSGKYLEWLDENFKLNNELDSHKHTSMETSVIKALEELQDQRYDLIISDPPSASSDGKKKSSALKDYEKTLPLMLNRLNQNGVLFAFLNTHTVGARKFEDKIKAILIDLGEKQFHIEKKLWSYDDCPFLKGFPEGSYLKGLVIKKL